MSTAIKLQPVQGQWAQASLRPIVDDDQQLVFASSPWTPLFFLLGAAAFSPGLFTAKAPAWRYVVFAIVLLLLTSGLRWTFWRERLTLDLVQRRYVHRHGYWPNIASDEGALDAIKSTALDVRVQSGSRGGESITWIVSLAFADGASVRVATFRLEALAYQYLDRLARRLHIPAVDRTGREEKKTDWNDTDKPLVERTGAVARQRQVPPQPDASRIVLSGDAPQRRIVLPRAGLRPSYFLYALVPLFPGWFTGTLHDLRIGAPFVAMAALFAFFAAVACLLNKEIVESGDSLCLRTRLFGATLSSKTLAKRNIVDVRLKPVPTKPWRRRDELQMRTASEVVNMTVPRLSRDDMSWLAAAIAAIAVAG